MSREYISLALLLAIILLTGCSLNSAPPARAVAGAAVATALPSPAMGAAAATALPPTVTNTMPPTAGADWERLAIDGARAVRGATTPAGRDEQLERAVALVKPAQ